MAYINGLYIQVVDEDISRGVNISSHPVEKGQNISDYVSRQAITASLSGNIVNCEGGNAPDILAQITAFKDNGILISYVGRNALSNMLISDFQTSHSRDIVGGMHFTMSLLEVSIAATQYIGQNENSDNKKTLSLEQVIKGSSTEKVYHITKKGDSAQNLAEKYKQFGSSMGFICDNNLDAQYVKRDGGWRNLQAGEKLLVGSRKVEA